MCSMWHFGDRCVVKLLSVDYADHHAYIWRLTAMKHDPYDEIDMKSFATYKQAIEYALGMNLL